MAREIEGEIVIVPLTAGIGGRNVRGLLGEVRSRGIVRTA